MECYKTFCVSFFAPLLPMLLLPMLLLPILLQQLLVWLLHVTAATNAATARRIEPNLVPRISILPDCRLPGTFSHTVLKSTKAGYQCERVTGIQITTFRSGVCGRLFVAGNFKSQSQSINMESQPCASWQELLIESQSGLVCMTRVIAIIFTQKASRSQLKDVATGLTAGGYSSIGDTTTTQSGKKKIRLQHQHLLNF